MQMLVNIESQSMILRRCCSNTLTLDCTVVGRPFDVTVWGGSAFNCSLDEIPLRHDRFTSRKGAHGECNNGSIVGQSLGTQNGSYTSQLNVTVTPDIIGENIECAHFDGVNTVIGTFTITDSEAGVHVAII